MNRDKLIKELELGLENPNVPDTFKDKIRVKLAALKAKETKETSPKTSISKPKFKVGDVVVLKGETTLKKEIIDRRLNNKNQYVYKAKYISKPSEISEWNENELEIHEEPEFKVGQKFKIKNGDILTIKDFDVKDHITFDDGKGNLSSQSILRESMVLEMIKNEDMLPYSGKDNSKLSTIEALHNAESKGWSATKADSGSEIRASDALTKKFAVAINTELIADGIKKGSLTEKEYDILVDENAHLLNEFLAWNNYYDKETSKDLQEMYERIYDMGNKQAANPKAISLETTYKSVKKTATPIKKAQKSYVANREIKSVTILKDGKKVTYSGKDVLNGANFFEKGGKLSDMAKYIVKSNIVSIEFSDGSKAKPENGYHIKNGAKPIMQNGGEVDLPQGSLINYQNYYLEKGGEVDYDSFDLKAFLNYVYPKAKEILKENNLKLEKDYTISKGKQSFLAEPMYSSIEGKARKVVIAYYDDEMEVVGTLEFNLEKDELHFEFEQFKIDEVDMYKLGGALKSAWTRERKYVNHKQNYETRYAKDKNRSGYKKFADGGEIENDKFEKVVYLPNENEFVKIKLEHNPVLDKYIYSVDGSVMSEHKTIEEAVAEADNEGLVNYPSKDSVVGTISTGKPVFENLWATDKAYKYFTKDDHDLAGKLWMSNKIDNKTKLTMTKRDELSADHFRKARTFDKNDKFEKGGVLKKGDDVICIETNQKGKVVLIEEMNDLEDVVMVQYANGKVVEKSSLDFMLDKPIAAKKTQEGNANMSKSEWITKHTNSPKATAYEKGGNVVKKKPGSKIFDKAKEIRLPGEKWTDAVKRAKEFI